MTSRRFEYEKVIDESLLDRFGHVNNAKYLEILEEARWDVANRNGFGLEEIVATQLGPVILEVTIRFKKELLLKERIKIVTEFLPRQGKIGYIAQEILSEDGKAAASATFTFALFDLKTRKIVEFTHPWLVAMGE